MASPLETVKALEYQTSPQLRPRLRMSHCLLSSSCCPGRSLAQLPAHRWALPAPAPGLLSPAPSLKPQVRGQVCLFGPVWSWATPLPPALRRFPELAACGSVTVCPLPLHPKAWSAWLWWVRSAQPHLLTLRSEGPCVSWRQWGLGQLHCGDQGGQQTQGSVCLACVLREGGARQGAKRKGSNDCDLRAQEEPLALPWDAAVPAALEIYCSSDELPVSARAWT